MILALPALLVVVFGPGRSDPAPAPGQTLPVLEAKAVGVTDGHVQLAWEAAGHDAPAAEFQLVESADAAFAATLLRYEGPARGSFVSGLPAGDYHYRLRQRTGEDAAWGPWSRPISVSIEPHSLALAWSLFGAGALLVLSILGFLVVADRRHRSVPT